MKFTIEIELGNEAMQYPSQVAQALEDIAGDLYDGGNTWRPGRRIIDDNGNTVGHYGATTS